MLRFMATKAIPSRGAAERLARRRSRSAARSSITSGQGVPQPDVGIALGRRAVDGDPQPVEPDPHELPPGGVVEHGPVGDQLDRAAGRLGLREHRQQVRVGERLPEPAEEHGRARRHLAHAVHDPGEGLRRHRPGRLVPDVADAGAAEEVAQGRRLDVDAGKGRAGPAEGDRVAALLDADERPVHQPEALGEVGGQDEMPSLVDPHPGRTVLMPKHSVAGVVDGP